MPPVIIAAAGAVVSSVATAAVAGTLATLTLGTVLANVAVAVVLSGVSMALAPKPKKASTTQQINSSTFAVRQPAESRKLVYGQTRIADVYGLVTSPDVNNEYLHLVVILCGHEVAEIGEVWASDYCIPPDWCDADGNVTQGRYAGVMRIRRHLGEGGQAADPFMVAEIPDWTVDHRLQGIAYLYVRLKFDRNKFPNGEPAFSAIVKGMKMNDPRRGLVFSTNTVLFANDYLRNSEYGFGAADASVDDDNISAEANIADEIVDTTELPMTVASVAAATNIITLAGQRLKFEIGDRCQVTSTGSIPGGLAALTDYYVIPYQFKDTPRIKLAASLNDAMDGIAIDISSAGSGTITITKDGEPRYHGGGVIDTANTLEDNLTSILSGCAGRATNIGGRWRVLTAAWRAPSVSLDEDDFRELVSVRTRVPMSERYNSIAGVYISSQNDYQAADFSPVSPPEFIEEDNGVKYPRDLNLPVTNRPETAQRIAKIELLRARQEIVLNLSASLAAMKLQAGDTTEISFARYGWINKVFEVTNFSLTVSDGEKPTVLTTMTLRETAEGIYTWTLAEAIANDPAPNTALPNPFDVVVPTGVGFFSMAADTQAADKVYSLFLQWDQHPDAFVREAGSMAISYKLTAETEWSPSFSVAGDQVQSAIVANSSVNTSYDIRIKAINRLGVESDWVTIVGAVPGSSGGVGTTKNWQTFSDSVTVTDNWQTFSDTVTTTDDWGYFT